MHVDKIIEKLKIIISTQIKKNNYEIALIAAKTLSVIYYEYNQIYTDIGIEDELLVIKESILKKSVYKTDKKCVFFYDGFGMDLRGLAVIYARALNECGYHIVYACPSNARGRIPHIIAEFDLDKTNIIYIEDNQSHMDKIKQINSIFMQYRPNVAFFYTYPSDVEGAIAFSNNLLTTRFQLDLTDHAYWIGLNAFDYTINGRDMGASIAHFGRGIPQNKIIKLDCTLYINKDKCNDTLPFDINTEKYIFTGGSLYKTLGDKNLYYYHTIDYILKNFIDIKFLYAGSGDSKEINKLIDKYPKRVYLIDERPDFYELIRNCVLYLNSYPMFGGLMMRYAALAGKIPITLKHNNDADGILINQENLGIEFDNYDCFIDEIYKLLSNDEYRREKERGLIGAVMTETDFVRNLKLLIEEHKTEYTFGEIKRFDTTEFRNEYKKRYTDDRLYKDIAKKNNIKLFRFFPKEYIFGSLIKIKEKLV